MAGITRHTPHRIPWHDLVQPTVEDVRILERTCHIDQELAKALLLPTVRPRVEHYGKFLFIALHFPSYDPRRGWVIPREIDFALNSKMLITAHYEPLLFLDEFVSELTTNVTPADAKGKKGAPTSTPVNLLRQILEKITEFELRQIDHVEKDIRALEDSEFVGRELPMLKRVSAARRNIIHFRRIVKPQEFVFHAFIDQLPLVLGGKETPSFMRTYRDYRRILQQLEIHHEALSALEDTHYAFLTMRTNQVIKFLTLMLVLFLPLSLLVLIFSMYPGLSLLSKWLIIVETTLLEITVLLVAWHRRVI